MRIEFAPEDAYTPGPDGAWGNAGVDDDGVPPKDDILEAGWAGSDDKFPPDYFNGRVLTITSGVAAGQSSRVVDFFPGNVSATTPTANVNGFFRVEAFQIGITLGGLVPGVDDEFYVNGQPFNGTGAGLDTTETITAPRNDSDSAIGFSLRIW